MLTLRQLHRIIQELCFKGTSVRGGRWSRFSPHWRPSRCGGLQRQATPWRVVLTLGRVTAGRGSCISRPHGNCPLVALTDLFWREHASLDGVERGLPLLHPDSPARCSMHLVDVDEYRTSQTCSRCFHFEGMKQCKLHRSKVCMHGDIDSTCQLLQQQHTGRHSRVDRDLNAVRNIGAKAVVQLFDAVWFWGLVG
jgi:hypothetical protein